MSIVLGLGFWQKYPLGIFNRRSTRPGGDRCQVQFEVFSLIQIKLRYINREPDDAIASQRPKGQNYHNLVKARRHI
jgi:hypothetical protein